MAMQLRTSLPLLIISISLMLLSSALVDIRAETDVRAVTKQKAADAIKRLSADKPNLLELTGSGCVLPGQVLNLKGERLNYLADYHLVLRAKKQFIALKQLSISEHKILVQIPRDTALKRGQSYPLLLLASNGANVSKQTGMTLRLCPSIHDRRLLPLREAHENGEILILAHSGISDQIIKEGAKLGYLLLRRYQLNSVNQTLMVLGGSDKTLNKTIKNLKATFADAEIDFNHHYFTTEQRHLLEASQQLQWPPDASCNPNKANRVAIGLLDGEIDMSHPALSAISIKTHNFLLPAQLADREHATAIAVLLVGNQPQQGFQGLVPFVTLKAASVVRQDEHTVYATAESIARAIDWFINEQVQLINVSLTGSHTNQVADFMFAESINHGLIVFAAAGNNGQKLSAIYPAALPGVIGITAVDAEGKALATANQGSYIDFAAPGVNIWTASETRQGQYRSGTSFAVPHAVSIAALYLSQQATLSRHRLFESMQFNAVDLGSQGYDNRYGWGQLQVNQQMCQH